MLRDLDAFVDYLPFLFPFTQPHSVVHVLFNEIKERTTVWVDEGKISDESCLLEKQFISHLLTPDYSHLVEKPTSPEYKYALLEIQEKIKAYHSFWNILEKPMLYSCEFERFREKDIFYYPELIHTTFGQSLKNIASALPLFPSLNHIPIIGFTVFHWNEKGPALGPIPAWDIVRAKKIEKEDGYPFLREFLTGKEVGDNTKYLVLNTAHGPMIGSINLDEKSAKYAQNFRKELMKGKIECLYIALKRFCNTVLGESFPDELGIKVSELLTPVVACIWEMLMWNTEGNGSKEASLIRSSNVCFIDAGNIYKNTEVLSSSNKPLFTLAHTENLLSETNEQLSFSFLN